VKDDGILLLIATRGCDILELFVPKSGPPTLYDRKSNKGFITRGHCNDELWGIATHPTLPYFCTVGDDKSLKFYSINTNNQLACIPLGQSARACAYHPSGKIIAIGFGTGGKGNAGGMIRLYTAQPLLAPVTKIDEKTDAKQWISDIKFSSDGNTLIAGAHDCKIYIYDVKGLSLDNDKVVTASLKLRTTFTKHNSVINHVDISSDGRFAQSNCSAYELLFSDITTGKQITSATELKDVKWDTWTCTLGWPVQGIWTGGMDGSDINAVSRSRSGIHTTTKATTNTNITNYDIIRTSISYIR